jgi:DNA-binding transcriptional ArsR family regulator
MAQAAAAASDLLKSLGNPTRLLILCRLTEAECSVGDLVALLGIRDSTVSQHLALLRKDRLVQTRREGQTIWYTITSHPARQVLETLFAIYCCPGQDASLPADSPAADPSSRDSSAGDQSS